MDQIKKSISYALCSDGSGEGAIFLGWGFWLGLGLGIGGANGNQILNPVSILDMAEDYKFIVMSIKSPDHYLQRLNQIPINAKQILQEIRTLDQEVLSLEGSITRKRDATIQMVCEYEERKTERAKSQIENQLKAINSIHKKLLKLTKKKKALAEKLYNLVDGPTEELEKDLTGIIPLEEVGLRKEQKGKRAKKETGEEYYASQPSYCYCKTPSFGLMVKCENEKCETQWFHTHCLEDDREFLGKWYCKDCRKSRQNRRS